MIIDLLAQTYDPSAAANEIAKSAADAAWASVKATWFAAIVALLAAAFTGLAFNAQRKQLNLLIKDQTAKDEEKRTNRFSKTPHFKVVGINENRHISASDHDGNLTVVNAGRVLNAYGIRSIVEKMYSPKGDRWLAIYNDRNIDLSWWQTEWIDSPEKLSGAIKLYKYSIGSEVPFNNRQWILHFSAECRAITSSFRIEISFTTLDGFTDKHVYGISLDEEDEVFSITRIDPRPIFFTSPEKSSIWKRIGKYLRKRE